MYSVHLVTQYYTDLSIMLIRQISPSTKDQNGLPSTAIDRFWSFLFRFSLFPKIYNFFFVLILDRIMILSWIMRLQNRFSIIAWRWLESINIIGRVFDEWKMMFRNVDALSISKHFNQYLVQICFFILCE